MDQDPTMLAAVQTQNKTLVSAAKICALYTDTSIF